MIATSTVISRTAGRVFLALLVVAFGCSDNPAGPSGDTFVLATINGAPLPAPDPDLWAAEIISGSLTLHPDGRLTATKTIRCKTDLPPSTTCQISNGGKVTSEGSYSRTEGWVQFGTPRWPGDQRYTTEFGAESVRILIASPPSSGGISPRYLLEYRR